MKKNLYLIGCLFFLFACRESVITLKYMKVLRPDGWEIKHIDTNTAEFKKDINGEQSLITIGSVKPSRTWQEMKPFLNRGTETISEKKIKLGDVEWNALERKKETHGFVVHSLFLFTNENGIGYTSILVTSDKNYAQLLPDFIKLMNSVKLIDN